MSWQAYRVVFRLRSPLHSGWRKVGNLQITRPYVIGRAVWGALTMRLTRDASQESGPATDSQQYLKIGKQVHQSLAFTYFYPALKSGTDYQVAWPWENEKTFRHRFLSSYPSTALAYPQQAAAEGLLHEVEFISPCTLDTGEPVFLEGYVFEKEGCVLDWRAAFKRLQVGGERGYGWGRLELEAISPLESSQLFHLATCEVDGETPLPLIRLLAGGRLLAHTPAPGGSIAGDIEPLVGREWRSHNSRRRYAGQHIAYTDICFVPGSQVDQASDFAVGKFGLWLWHPISVVLCEPGTAE